MINIISATQARKRWFELLNLVYFQGESVIIEKNSIPIVRLTSVKKPSLKSTDEVILKTAGFLRKNKTFWPSEDLQVRKRELDRVKNIWRE